MVSSKLTFFILFLLLLTTPFCLDRFENYACVSQNLSSERQVCREETFSQCQSDKVYHRDFYDGKYCWEVGFECETEDAMNNGYYVANEECEN